jgi:ABC-type dipeptide/oligopeptide/nickel transport system permease component
MTSLHGPLRFLLRRLGTAVLTLIGLVTIVFAMIKLIPGDEARVAAGEGATPEQVQRIRAQLGLDKPLTVQFGRYLGKLAHGDLGISIVTHRPVASDIGAVLPATAQLVVLALVIALLVSIPAASVAAVQSGRGIDTASRISVIVAAGLPTFWLALVFQWLFGTLLHVLPISGTLSIGLAAPRWSGMTVLDSLRTGNLGIFLDALRHLILPAVVLSIPAGAQFFRLLRAEMLAVLQREHITVARAKGVPMRRIVVGHALPNAFGPLLTQLGIQVGFTVASVVLIESIFSLPGIGTYLFNSVEQRDIFAVLGAVLTIGVIVVAANFLVDIAQLWRDPQLRAAQIGGEGVR